MRKRIGFACIAMGIVCLLTAIGFVIYNGYEARYGEKNSQELLQNIQDRIQKAEQTEQTQPGDLPAETIPENDQEDTSRLMQTVPVGEYDSIGILSIPVLKLELPVLADWSYAKLKKSPCHYYGSCYEPDFVIAGHNYTSHFGRIRRLLPGDLVLFTDATGQVHCYEVVLLETLAATATEEMITSGFDLTLYTCTLGGSNRVTVRCKRVNP